MCVAIEAIDAQDTEESSISIVIAKQFICGYIRLCIDIAQSKKAPSQVQKAFAITLELTQNSMTSPNKVDIPLLKEVVESF
jgi:hypothetical protein